MITHCSLDLLREVAGLSRNAIAASRRANAHRPVHRAIDRMSLPWTLTAEERRFYDFLDELSHDQLLEIQACYWLGASHPPVHLAEQALADFLEYSARNTGHMQQYLHAKGFLPEALSWTLVFLSSRPDLVGTVSALMARTPEAQTVKRSSP